MGHDIIKRRVMRAKRESAYINTINLSDRVRIEFVWYPAEAGLHLRNSWVDTLVPAPATDGTERTVEYTWALSGRNPIKRTMNSGRIMIALPPGATGTLTVFGTSWEITRAAAGEAMDAGVTVRGMQQRLNALGYHLRAPGDVAAGVDGIAGRLTETAVLAFQADYRPEAGSTAPNRLPVRGEWASNPAIAGNLNWYNKYDSRFPSFNPSATDSAALQTALVAVVGA